MENNEPNTDMVRKKLSTNGRQFQNLTTGKINFPSMHLIISLERKD